MPVPRQISVFDLEEVLKMFAVCSNAEIHGTRNDLFHTGLWEKFRKHEYSLS